MRLRLTTNPFTSSISAAIDRVRIVLFDQGLYWSPSGHFYCCWQTHLCYYIGLPSWLAGNARSCVDSETNQFVGDTSRSVFDMNFVSVTLVATVILLFLSIVRVYFALIFYCQLETHHHSTRGHTSIYTSEQLCAQFYSKYPIDLMIYAANARSMNVATLMVSLDFFLSIYGRLREFKQMGEYIGYVYQEMKNTSEFVVSGISATALLAIKSVWDALPIIETIEWTFKY